VACDPHRSRLELRADRSAAERADVRVGDSRAVFGILGDSRWRRFVVVCGGVGCTAALAAAAVAPGFAVLLVAFVVLSPANGAFVSLSQATLMDVEPA
jgi:MFS family permease